MNIFESLLQEKNGKLIMGGVQFSPERSKKWNGDTLGYEKEVVREMGWENENTIITDSNFIASIITNFDEAQPVPDSVIVSVLHGGGKKIVWASESCPKCFQQYL